MQLTRSFAEFLASEKAGGALLAACTVVALAIANSAVGPAYLAFWQTVVAGLSIEHWVNDGLMAVFFLFVGLELERELYNGELSQPRKALLPILAALGGVAAPALIHYAFNAGTPAQVGIGIPMATDIAFALGALALLGDRVPLALKVFLTALAVMDDLVAIVVIALFYTTSFSAAYLAGALAVFAVLLALNLRWRVMVLAPYLVGGALMWYLMLRSGVHATIAGVLLAFAIPFSARSDDEASPSHRLEHRLNRPVAFVVLPVFALANTGVVLGGAWAEALFEPASLGIIAGLVLGKPLGIVLVTLLAVRLGLCAMPEDTTRAHILGAGLLAGIGFTMSIFIAQLAFAGDAAAISAAKRAILAASTLAGALGIAWLRGIPRPTPPLPPSAVSPPL